MTRLPAALAATSLLALAACGGGDDTTEMPSAATMTDTAGADTATRVDDAATTVQDDRDAAAAMSDGPPETSPIAELPAGRYTLDKGHAYVTASYSHLGFSNPILRWDDVDAEVTLDPDAPEQSTLRVMIDPASVNSGVERFDEHLTSGDMFDVATYGDDITFTSTTITMTSATEGTMTGDLTMKGQTHPVTLGVTLNGAGMHPMQQTPHFGVTALGQISRSQWDLGYATPNVGDEVDLRIEAEFSKADAGADAED